VTNSLKRPLLETAYTCAFCRWNVMLFYVRSRPPTPADLVLIMVSRDLIEAEDCRGDARIAECFWRETSCDAYPTGCSLHAK
jgi:hypothetical protein